MEEKTSTVELLFEKIKHFIHSNIELTKLKAIEKVAEIVSSLVSNLIILLVVCIFFLIFNIGLSFYIGDLLQKTYYGFFIVSGFYALVALFLVMFKNTMIKIPISNLIITEALK